MKRTFGSLAVATFTAAAIALGSGVATAAPVRPADVCQSDGECHRSFDVRFNDGSGGLAATVWYTYVGHGLYDGGYTGTTYDGKADGLCIMAEVFMDGTINHLNDSYVCGAGHKAEFHRKFRGSQSVYLRVCTVDNGRVRYCGPWH